MLYKIAGLNKFTFAKVMDVTKFSTLVVTALFFGRTVSYRWSDSILSAF